MPQSDHGSAGDPTLRPALKQAALMLLWALCFTGASQAIKRQLLPNGPILWAIAALPTLVGIYLVSTYARYIRALDELHRLIELQSLALAFGGGFVAITSYRILERPGAPPADIGDFIIVMALFYVIGTLVGWRRYR